MWEIIDTTYTLHGHTLEVVYAIKYLGVTITESLTSDKHIGNITSKASRTLGLIRRNLGECTSPVKEASYKAMATRECRHRLRPISAKPRQQY